MSVYRDLPNETYKVEQVVINQQKLSIDDKYITDYDIILIESGTGTGKTKEIAKKSKLLVKTDNTTEEIKLDDKEFNVILSIVNLITLSLEQIDTFYEESNIKLSNYQDVNFSTFNNDNLVICINSLQKILNLKDSYFKNVVLYIDEVNNLHETMTHNKTLDKNLNIIYTCLMKLIKNCKKIIFTDATINQNCFNLLSSRKTNNKTIFIRNTNKKYEGIEAIRYNDKNEFYNKLKEHIKNKDYFLFGCDVCSILTTYFNDLANEFPDMKKDFILITSETNYRIKNASIQFKDKFVFYSPSITTGVNFLYKKRKQTQFLYITGESVNPIGAYQMASRTRNIRELIYFCEEIKPQKMRYESIEDVENKYEKMIEVNDKVLRLSQSINIDEESEIIKNSFFKMFCYNEFITNIFYTGYLKHFENILTKNGFKLKEVGVHSDLDVKIKVAHTKLRQEVKDDLIYEFGRQNCDNFKDENKEIKLNVEVNEDLYLKRCEILGLVKFVDNKTVLEYDEVKKYQMLIQEDKALNNYFNFLKLVRTDEYISNKLYENNIKCQKIKNLQNSYTKVNLLRTYEKNYKIERFNFEEDKIDLSNPITNELQELISTTFRLKNQTLKTKKDVNSLYIKMIENLCGDIDIVVRTRKGRNKVKHYNINETVFIALIELQQIKDPYLTNFNIELIKKYYKGFKEIQHKPLKITHYGINDDINDGEEEYNKYIFSKQGKQ